jgi:hypothetical protein
MRLTEYLIAEGFFKNSFYIEKLEAEKLSIKYGKNWEKTRKTWTMHDGENHLFTYNTKTEELMTDKSKQELSKVVKFK